MNAAIFFILPLAVAAVLIVWSIVRYTSGAIGSTRMIRSILVYVVLGAFWFGYDIYYDRQAVLQANGNTIDNLLSKQNAMMLLRVNHVEAPFFSSLPGLLPSEYRGFFTVSRADGKLSSDCEITTFDYIWRSIGDDRFVINIDGPTMAALAACGI
ncbi:hypothetical protein [Rhizobium sp. GCM10022189]|uniref:hypothetical protein n=1 Tax=Rhizobium sp. GCM10022189 TaxID=3252654 RepID=UPI00360BC866